MRLMESWDFLRPTASVRGPTPTLSSPLTAWRHSKALTPAGSDISQSAEDRWLMDLLRAHADAIIMGVNTLVEETLQRATVERRPRAGLSH